MSIAPLLAVAQVSTTAAPATGAGGADFIMQMAPLLLVFVIFYVLMIRPQQARAKKHAATLAAVKKNDEVIKGGGLRGRVTKVMDDDVEVEIAPNVRVRAVKSTLNGVVTCDSNPAND